MPGGDAQTIVPALFRIVRGVPYQRKRIATPDADFLDIDFLLREDSKKMALLIHGLEANTSTPYMKGMAKALFHGGWSVAAMNLRGCSGHLNQQPRAYHSGATDDVSTVINYILENNYCEELVMVGFSLGGNLILKYLGEQSSAISKRISKAVTVSVPCDLAAGVTRLDNRLSFIYRDRFLRSLRWKLLLRQKKLPFTLDPIQIKKIASLVEFDNLFTAPMYGFKDAMDYYQTCSAKNFITPIRIPSLILTARNDPFFTERCLPIEECKDHQSVFLETPDEGGHVGFCLDLLGGSYYSEQRTLSFLKNSA